MDLREKPSRRRVLERFGAIGALALMGPLRPLLAQLPDVQLTPEQIMGPFYPVIKPLDRDADLTVIKGKRGRAQGQVIELMGRVVNRRGEPVRSARLELWQANTHGRYAHPADVNQAPLDPNFQGFGVQGTDREGRYRFKTIKPGAYLVDPTNKRTPHIHFDIAGANDRLVTQMYFPDEPLNEQDLIYTQLGASKVAAVGRILRTAKEFEPDSLVLVWDVVLDKG